MGTDLILLRRMSCSIKERQVSREQRAQSSGAAIKAQERQKSEIRSPKPETNSNFVNF
jgi:hypothetical protein